MSEEMFVRCCAPTLAGLKTGSMFSCEYSCRKEMTADLRRLNRILSRSGLCRFLYFCKVLTGRLDF